MKDRISRFAILVAAASLMTLPLPAKEPPGPKKPVKPTLEEILSLQARLEKEILDLQARLEEFKSSDLTDDQKIPETLKLKNAIEDTWQRLGEVELKALDEVLGPAPGPKAPSDLYFRGWLLSRDAEELAHAQQPEEALEKLDRARNLFDFVARVFPNWKPEMVKGRRAQTAESIALLSKQVPAPERK